MIDILYARYARRKEKPLDSSYKIEDSIQKERLINKNSDKLAVIFPGWHTHNFPVNILAKRLSKKGWAVLFYDFHDQILVPDEETVVESFRYLRDHIVDEVKKLTSTRGYKEIYFVGISLGNVPLTLVADKFSDFTGATLVVAGDNLAIDMWYGIRTVDIRHSFEKMHVGVRRLSEEWQDVSPINHVQHFAGKKVKVIMSLNDKFVATPYQKKLAERITEIGANVDIKHNRVGHTLSIIKFCLFDSPI